MTSAGYVNSKICAARDWWSRWASASTAGSQPTRLRALRTGAVDAVQVVYNIFDQNPEDELFPLCRELDVAVNARVPFDEAR